MTRTLISASPRGNSSYTIIVRKISRPPADSVNAELQWLGQSLGLFGLRDKDQSCFRVFIELLKAAKLDHPLSSDELAYRLDLSRGTIVHHLNHLIENGLVIVSRRKYVLREANLHVLLEKMKEDFDRTYKELQSVAKDIDERLGR